MTGSGRDERGQAAVELALALPLVALLFLLLTQAALLARDVVAVTHAAREAAREAAVAAGDRPRRAAAASGLLRPERLRVEVIGRGPPGDVVEVRVTYRAPTEVPVVGRLLPEPTMSATARTRVEM